MSGNLVFPLIIAAAGVIMLVMGIFRRGRARSMKAAPCRSIASLVGGEKQFITGKTYSPACSSSPVSKTPCVFYVETIEKNEKQYSSSEENTTYWVLVASNVYGAFFVVDASGKALVAPTPESLDLRRPATTESNDIPLVGGMAGAIRKTEQLIAPDETVAVMGTPRPLTEFMRYLRQNTQLNMRSEFMAELLRLENSADPGMPCFFGGGVEKVADRSYGDYLSGTEASASFLLQAGAALAAAGGGAVLYALKVFSRAVAD
ncbi:MAG: hypothetical protein Q7R35_11460 [Elusimicrobiota bacterium]|nr:hypothetical protein [Elusimicrobiota bacterium]